MSNPHRCILGEKNRRCNGQCTICAWNPEELERRKAIIRVEGLQVGLDGLKRLHIRKKKEENTTDAD